MKRFLFATLVVALLAIFIFSATSTVATAESDWQNSDIYLFVQDFVLACPDRSGARNEKSAAEYLKSKFDELLLLAGQAPADIVPFGTSEINGYNLVAKIDNPNTDIQIIIGAHFDSVGNGANDNASGVAALYFTLQNLLQAELPCDVVFVAFGGEEQTFLGSYSYVGNMSVVEKENTLLMFNFDCLANGDNLYLFCENKHTSLADLILKNKVGEVEIFEKPYAVGVYPLDIFGFGYYETVQSSDQTPFRLAGIPTAFLFAGNFVGWNYTESADASKRTMNSNADTLESLDKNGAVWVQRVQTAVSTVCATVLSDEFLAVGQNARNELLNNELWFNSWWPRLAVAGMVVILIVLAFFHHRKLEKNALLGTPEVKTEKIFTTPDAQDIFTFEGQNDNSNDDIEDIFTFKK